MEPATLRWTALERLTTGPGPDMNMAVSFDGKRLAFTAGTERVRLWMYPFDAKAGTVVRNGKALTPAGIEAWMPDLSRDGKKLAFVARRAGKWELWEKSLVGGREILLANDGQMRMEPRWSPNDTRLSYGSWNPASRRYMLLLANGGNEEAVTAKSCDCDLRD